LIRILIDGAQDLDAVHRLQDAIAIAGPQQTFPTPDPVPTEASGVDFVRVVNNALAVNPPPAHDNQELNALREVGIGAEAAPLTLRQQLLWRVAYPLLQQWLISATKSQTNLVDGWSYTRASIGDFGVDYPYRAAVALRGLLALPPVEAVYSVPAADSVGAKLSGEHRYRLHLPPGTPPARAFWSLSVYEPAADGGLYFATNSLSRYSIGDRTTGLVRNADGSLDLFIQHDAPSTSSNWLPTPAGELTLVMRAYLPSEELQQGRFRYPPLVRLD
jgi:hypothetical protein